MNYVLACQRTIKTITDVIPQEEFMMGINEQAASYLTLPDWMSKVTTENLSNNDLPAELVSHIKEAPWFDPASLISRFKTIAAALFYPINFPENEDDPINLAFKPRCSVDMLNTIWTRDVLPLIETLAPRFKHSRVEFLFLTMMPKRTIINFLKEHYPQIVAENRALITRDEHDDGILFLDDQQSFEYFRLFQFCIVSHFIKERKIEILPPTETADTLGQQLDNAALEALSADPILEPEKNQQLLKAAVRLFYSIPLSQDLIEEVFRPKYKDPNHDKTCTIYEVAALTGNEALLLLLLKLNGDDRININVLCAACFYNQAKTAKMLLEWGTPITLSKKFLGVPFGTINSMEVAIDQDHPNMVSLLLAHGEDATPYLNDERLPKSPEILKLLQQSVQVHERVKIQQKSVPCLK